MELISAEDLTFGYSGTDEPAIRDIDLSIKEAEFIILAGPSGCGKSTLCRCLNGLIPQFYTGNLRGRVTVHGQDASQTPIHVLSQNVGMVFQNPENQLFSMTVEADIAFALENLAVPRDKMKRRISEAVAAVGIEDLRRRSPFELSGGQQQKVAIASILALQPKVMILDEPTSFLDSASAEALIQTVSRLRKQLNLSIILVEHRLDLAVPHSTRVIIMDKGSIVHDGEPAEVLAKEDLHLLGVGVPKAVAVAKNIDKVKPIFNNVPLTVGELAANIEKLVH